MFSVLMEPNKNLVSSSTIPSYFCLKNWNLPNDEFINEFMVMAKANFIHKQIVESLSFLCFSFDAGIPQGMFIYYLCIQSRQNDFVFVDCYSMGTCDKLIKRALLLQHLKLT